MNSSRSEWRKWRRSSSRRDKDKTRSRVCTLKRWSSRTRSVGSNNSCFSPRLRSWRRIFRRFIIRSKFSASMMSPWTVAAILRKRVSDLRWIGLDSNDSTSSFRIEAPAMVAEHFHRAMRHLCKSRKRTSSAYWPTNRWTPVSGSVKPRSPSFRIPFRSWFRDSEPSILKARNRKTKK